MTPSASAMTPAEVDLPYRLAWRARTARVGAHRSTLAGSGGMFRDLTSLLDARDPRRIDLRQSLRDPFEQIHVRRFEQTSAITVTMLADVSASMSFVGRARKFTLLQQLAQVVSASAMRTGDSFAFLAADSRIRRELTLQPTRSRSAIASLRQSLHAFTPDASHTTGLLRAASSISTRRGLVFLVTDVLINETELAAIFERLSRHDVIPIALYDSAEIDALPDWGLMELADLETRRRRLVVLRPAYKKAWRDKIEARRATFRATARRFGREPFEATDRIDWDKLGAHLARGGG